MSKIQFLFFAIVLVCFGAHARSPIMSHDRFVYLSSYEQEQLIIKTMELVVDLEARYEYEVSKYGYDEKRYRQYTFILNKIMSLVIDSAHAEWGGANILIPDKAKKAAEKRKHEQKAKQNFQNISNAASIDAIKAVTGKTSYQMRANAEVPLIQNKSWDEIATDFKNQSTSGNKCIYGGWISQLNSSGHCTHPNNLPGTDVHKTYSQQSDCPGTQQITCNPIIFGYKNAEKKSLFCVAAGTSNSENSALNCMNKALSIEIKEGVDSRDKRLKYIRDSFVAKADSYENVQKFVYRYCVCEAAPGNMNADYHKRVQSHRTCFGMIEMVAETSICEEPKIDVDTTIFKKLRDAAIGSSSGKALDDLYGKFLTDVKEKNKQEYTALCGGGDSGGQGTVPATNPTPTKQDPIPEKPKLSCSVECKPVEAPKTEAAKTEGQQTPAAAAPADAANTTPASGTSAGQTPASGTQATPTPAAPKYTCSYEFKLGDKVVTSDPAPTTIPEEKAETFTVKAVIEKKEESVECKVLWSVPETETPTETPKTSKIEVKLKGDAKKDSQDVEAIVTDGDGLKIIWWREKFPHKKKEDTKPSVIAEGADKPEEDESSSSEQIAEDKKEVTVERAKKEYQVCAKLVDGDGNDVVKAEKCADIPKLAEEKEKPTTDTPVSRGAQNQQPQGPMRMGNDTSATGIK